MLLGRRPIRKAVLRGQLRLRRAELVADAIANQSLGVLFEMAQVWKPTRMHIGRHECSYGHRPQWSSIDIEKVWAACSRFRGRGASQERCLDHCNHPGEARNESGCFPVASVAGDHF